MSKQEFRIEKDSMGELQVPRDALYGAQTQRAIDNFPISGLAMPREFIRALGQIKAACAKANIDLGLIDENIANAIITAAQQVSDGDVDSHFPVDVFQTGSGTSSNMNTNEVISHLAANAGVEVHPNDHVNMGQSSNDVIPTAIHVSACIGIHENLLPALEHLASTLRNKAEQVKQYVKTVRGTGIKCMGHTGRKWLSAYRECFEISTRISTGWNSCGYRH
jgi:fumarate hydratase class II